MNRRLSGATIACAGPIVGLTGLVAGLAAGSVNRDPDLARLDTIEIVRFSRAYDLAR